MASIDSEAIMNFDSNYRKASRDFNSSSYSYFPDYNNLSYNSGILKFDTLTTKDQFTIFADSYLAMNLSVSTAAGGTAYLPGDAIAFKNSTLSLITGIQINSGSGQTLVNDQSIQYINTIRRLLETSWEAQQTNMNELQLWKDQSLPGVFGASSAIQNAAATLSFWGNGNALGSASFATNSNSEWLGTGGPPITSATLKNPVYNEGFARRVGLFKANSTFANGVFSTTLFIPLRYIHPFFAKLDFPIINTRFQINFYTPMNNTTAAVTLNTPLLRNSVGGATFAVATTDAQIQIVGPTYIYYRKVTYLPEDNAKVSEMIARGHAITLEYPSTDYYNSIGSSPVGLNSNSRTDLVSSSTVAPLRVWQILLPNGYTNGALVTASNDASGNPYAMQTCPFAANNTVARGNVLINSQRYYDNDLGANGQIGAGGLTTGFHDFWEVLEEQTVGHGFNENLGSLLGYKDFLSTYNFNVYDVSRLKDRLPNPSESVNIQVQYSSGSSPVPYTALSQPLYLVERQTVAQLNFASGSVSISIGSQAI